MSIINYGKENGMRLENRTVLITGGSSGIVLSWRGNFSGVETRSLSPGAIRKSSMPPGVRYPASMSSEAT